MRYYITDGRGGYNTVDVEIEVEKSSEQGLIELINHLWYDILYK